MNTIVVRPVLGFLGGWEAFLLTTGALVVALLVGAAVIGFVRRWRELGDRGQNANQQLTHFRTLYERGELSEQEFNRLRELLIGQVRKETGLPGERPPPSQGVKNDDSP